MRKRAAPQFEFSFRQIVLIAQSHREISAVFLIRLSWVFSRSRVVTGVKWKYSTSWFVFSKTEVSHKIANIIPCGLWAHHAFGIWWRGNFKGLKKQSIWFFDNLPSMRKNIETKGINYSCPLLLGGENNLSPQRRWAGTLTRAVGDSGVVLTPPEGPASGACAPRLTRVRLGLQAAAASLSFRSCNDRWKGFHLNWMWKLVITDVRFSELDFF